MVISLDQNGISLFRKQNRYNELALHYAKVTVPILLIEICVSQNVMSLYCYSVFQLIRR